MKFNNTFTAMALLGLACILSGCAHFAYGQNNIGTGLGETVATPPAQEVELTLPDGTRSAGLLIEPAQGTSPRLVQRWSGCFETVYVPDPDTGTIRKLTRQELRNTTKEDRPGTGSYGEWKEAYCEVPGSPSFGHSFAWPKTIEQKEVTRLLGPSITDHFEKNSKATVSRTYNLTGYPFTAVGHHGSLSRDHWLTIPALKTEVTQRLDHHAEDTGRIIGDPFNKPVKTEIYTYNKEPQSLLKAMPAPRLRLTPPASAPEPASRRAPDTGARGDENKQGGSRPALVATA